MNVGYLVNTYPRASHSFIRREIQAIERLGQPVKRFAMRSDRATLVDADDLAEDELTHHILSQSKARLVSAALAWCAGHPGGAMRAFGLAMLCGKRGAGGVPGTGGRLRHLIYLLEAAYLAQACHEQKIDHIHAHFGTNSTTVAMLCAAMGGPAYSFTTHGPEEFDAPMALALDLKIANATFAVAISSFGRSQLARWVPQADWPKLHVVHCGIEPEKFAAPTAPTPTGTHLVAIGRFAAQKGFSLLIESIALAAPSVPKLHLTLIGDGELRAQIETEIQKHGVNGHVTLAGWQSEAGVRAALRTATALIVPSFAEGLPVVVMEAMAAARPVIATAIAGIPELVTPDTGWLVPAGDPVALAAAIATLGQTPADRLVEMGLAARARALSRHDVNTEAAKLLTLFAKHTRA